MSYEVLLVINHKQIAILFPICGEEPFLFHSFFRLLLLFFSFFASLQLAVIKASVYTNDGFMAEKSLRSATELRPTRATTFRGGCGGGSGTCPQLQCIQGLRLPLLNGLLSPGTGGYGHHRNTVVRRHSLIIHQLFCGMSLPTICKSRSKSGCLAFTELRPHHRRLLKYL